MLIPGPGSIITVTITDEAFMIAGFTGSRKLKLTEQQKNTLAEFIKNMEITEFHHGDCIGADASVHEFIRLQFPGIRIIIHPPVDSKNRAFCEGDVILDKKDYMERNRDIVDSCDVLFALPPESSNPRSGTLATIRYSEKKQIAVIKLG